MSYFGTEPWNPMSYFGTEPWNPMSYFGTEHHPDQSSCRLTIDGEKDTAHHMTSSVTNKLQPHGSLHFGLWYHLRLMLIDTMIQLLSLTISIKAWSFPGVLEGLLPFFGPK
jgi:hypothetical protein